MDDHKQTKETRTSCSTPVTDLSHPIVLERDGQPVSVLMSYERYQALSGEQQVVSALEARRVADRAVFGGLVGCALSSGDPAWFPPEPHWHVPYRSLDGTVLTV